MDYDENEGIETGLFEFCGMSISCHSVNLLKDQVEEKDKKLKEVTKALKEKESLLSAFEILFGNLSKGFFFTSFQNHYKKIIKEIPEIKIAAIGEIDGVIDIWTILKSNKIELRKQIAGYHVEIIKLWDQVEFEFMTIPVLDEEDIEEIRGEELTDMYIFYEV